MTDQDPAPPVIQTRAIVKSFAGVQALRGVDFAVHPGEIHALLGQNGAGKSTLVKILNGVHKSGSYSGEILVDGKPATFASTSEARARGVGYVPQEIEVLEQLSVAENVFAGHTGLGRGMIISRRRMEAETRALFQDLGLAIDPRLLVASLTSAQRHLVMIARALSFKPARADARRADRLAVRCRGRAPVPGAAPTEGAGQDDDLHHPPPAGSAGHLRPRHGAARWPGRRRDRARGF
ncbi:MAG: ATP-binding cassette domain-containing protein [Candidatus Kaistia colombiensis]|nr:MAG: ATP-binding cassette domain-containing protein [Kaistia sp.]